MNDGCWYAPPFYDENHLVIYIQVISKNVLQFTQVDTSGTILDSFKPHDSVTNVMWKVKVFLLNTLRLHMSGMLRMAHIKSILFLIP